MQQLVSRADIAREKNVSRMAVTKAIQDGRIAAGACVGSRVDRAHPSVVGWNPKGAPAQPKAPEKGSKQAPKTPAVRRDPAPTQPAPPVQRGRPSRKATASAVTGIPAFGHGDGQGSDADLEELTEFLQPLLKRFGTDVRFSDWLDSLKTIEDIRGKRLANEKTEGRLIERELVEVHVFGAIDEAFRRLLTDTPKTLTRELYTASKTGLPVEEAEGKTRQALSKLLKTMKDKATRALKEQ